jgi:tRNA (mo5U34)-methyltransferase
MISLNRFLEFLKTTQAGNFTDAISAKLDEVVQTINHGDFEKWLGVIDSLPNIHPSQISLDLPAIKIGSDFDCDDDTRADLKDTLMKLHPWRKGPFDIFGLHIDTEWRSDIKWDRLKNKIAPLKDKCVLDVGCGSGYHCLRMKAAGAKAVVGIDPFLLFVMQFLALNKYIKDDSIAVLPLGIEDLPTECPSFDTIFSMGVIYHRKDPMEHLRHLKGLLAKDGQIVIESLVIDVPDSQVLKPSGRYAKMRNVWNIPSPAMLAQWLKDAGFADVKIIDVSPTTNAEQRKTEWMTFESLEDFLDPANQSQTIEGYPAPVRAVCVGNKHGV